MFLLKMIRESKAYTVSCIKTIFFLTFKSSNGIVSLVFDDTLTARKCEYDMKETNAANRFLNKQSQCKNKIK